MNTFEDFLLLQKILYNSISVNNTKFKTHPFFSQWELIKHQSWTYEEADNFKKIISKQSQAICFEQLVRLANALNENALTLSELIGKKIEIANSEDLL